MKKLFQYAILFNAPQTKEAREAGEDPETKLLRPVDTILAKDEHEATIRVAREIPADYLDKIDRVILVIRPF